MNNHIEDINRKLLTGSIDLSQSYDLCQSSINFLMNQLYSDLIPLGVAEFSCYIKYNTEVWIFKTFNAKQINSTVANDISNLLIKHNFEKIILPSRSNETVIIGYNKHYARSVLIEVNEKFQIFIESIIESLWYQLFEYN